MLSYSKIISWQFGYLSYHLLYKSFSKCYQLFCLVVHILQSIRYFKLQTKYSTLNRSIICSSFTFIYSKEIKIPTKIENIKFRLIHTVNKPRAQSCSTPYHLPKLCITHYLLEKYKVYNLRHINTGIKHINRNSYLRKFICV